jgi:multiple sugar transport system substrate-binding protein
MVKKTLAARTRWIWALVLCAAILGSCVNRDRPGKRNPVSVSVWHTMGGPMKIQMDQAMEEFNLGPGSRMGITVSSTLVADTAVLHEKLSAAAAGEPASFDLPDMAAVYPNMALLLARQGLLADLGGFFSAEELARFVPEFIAEGRLGGETLYLLPFAKSTETLFVNTVLFDRFASDTGARLEDLSTFEGIAKTADAYFRWSGGKVFFHADSWFNFFMINAEALGESLAADGRLRLNGGAFRYLWDWYFRNTVRGRAAIFEGYGNYLAKTGDIVCAVASSSGGAFYPDSVTYADNTREKAEWAVLPYPQVEGGSKIAMQRGAGMCVIRSSPAREYAAAQFLKWFTQEERNGAFTEATSYMPVLRASLAARMAEMPESNGGGDAIIKKMYHTVAAMREGYRFYIPPVFDGFEDVQRRFTRNVRKAAETGRERYRAALAAEGEAGALRAASAGAYEQFIAGDY